MKAKKKPFVKMTAEDLNVDLSSLLNIIEVVEPPVRKGGRKVESVQELVDKLKTEAGVI
jgi:electron transfer flavoprotein beta subunit